jgi:hypothetical protein
MSIKISELDIISEVDLIDYSSSVVFPLVANVTGNLVTYQTSISNVKSYVTSADTVFAANVTAANLIANTGIYGTIRTPNQSQITSLGTLTALTLSGSLVGTSVSAAIIGNTGANLVGTLGTNAQPNITSIGTLTSLTLSGTLTGTTINAATFGNSGATYTGSNYTSTGTITGNVINAAVIGNSSATLTGNLSTGTQPNITSVGTLTSLTVSGTLTTTNILPSANNTSNIGDSTHWYNTIFATSQQALYADLAEKYISDAAYEPGTVVVFGGSAEITVTDKVADTRVAGIISTDPAYVMNAGIDGLLVAMRGRVPCKVIGPVAKGDLLVTSHREGYAISINQNPDWVTTQNINTGISVFAKSLENNETTGPIIIEAVVV